MSVADPPVAGEGSLDPLGLAQIADRLADHLLPGIRARMRRVRFLTAAAVGALASEDLFDVMPTDGVSSPSVCFEWLVLEAFARTLGQGAPLEASGVPGSSKVRAVRTQGKRLTARNYLRAPGTFGFTGVYLPLARHFHVLDDDRRPGANLTALTRAWEEDQGLYGFTDGTPDSAGAKFRSRIRSQVHEALKVGHCAESENGHLWKRLCSHLHPLQPGAQERQLLMSWFMSPDEPVCAALARVLMVQPEADEQTLIALLLDSTQPADVRLRLEAIAAYERLSWLLDAAFRELRRVSTHRGTTPVTVSMGASDSVLMSIAAQLPQAMQLASEALAPLDGALVQLLGERLGRFELPMSAGELTETLMAHHDAVQAAKAPKGKRPWFDRHGQGWVVRSLYSHPELVDPTAPTFVHPYRLTPLQTFMKDLSV